jgi:hypothetical protein
MLEEVELLDFWALPGLDMRFSGENRKFLFVRWILLDPYPRRGALDLESNAKEVFFVGLKAPRFHRKATAATSSAASQSQA